MRNKTNLAILLTLFLAFCFNAKAQTATVIVENANLRGTPNSNGKIVDTVSEGAALQVLQQKNVWFLVQSTDFVGWIHGDTIKYSSNAFGLTRSSPAPRPARVSKPPASSGNYIRGPRGGCYYINGSGRKQYVDRGLCN